MDSKKEVQHVYLVGAKSLGAYGGYETFAIGFGGVREIAPSLFRNINFAFYDDRRCAEFLWDLL